MGVSASGAATNDNTPVVALMLNLAASAPPVMEKVSVAPASASVATTVVTDVPFSATLTAAVAAPPFEVMIGVLSLTLVTVTAIVWVSALVPSDTCTCTS